MYMSFYKFRSEPFGITPDPRFLFLSAAHREALAALVYGVSQRKGFISIIGEVGTGKTIILRAFLEGIDPAQTTAISLLNPLATFDQILDEILPTDFAGTSSDRFRTLQEWLISEYRQGRNVVVAIDEAQCMSPATMERLRLLSNLETAEHKLIQVVLAGQPELEQKLAQPNLRQFRERIAVRAKIWPLNRADSIAYINHRLAKVARPDGKPVFTQLALKYLASQAKGNPRKLNILCDSSLLTGFSYRKRPIPWIVAWESRTGMRRPPGHWKVSTVRALAVVGLIAMTIGVAVFGLRQEADDPTRMTSSASGAIEQQAIARSNEGSRIVSSEHEFSVPEPTIFEQKDVQTDVVLAKTTVDNNSNNDPVESVAMGNPVFAEYSLATEKVTINKGDGLWQLCREIYGEVDAEMVRKVLEANPHIRNPNDLTIGDEITFPPLAIAGNPATARMTNAVHED